MMRYLSGFLLSLCIAGIAAYLSNLAFIKDMGLSAIVLAIFVGLLLGNTLYPHINQYCQTGVDFCKGRVLRIAIILFGIKITFQDIAVVGYQGIIIDILMVTFTFLFTFWVAMKLFKLDQDSAILIGSGCAICGAAAIIATESTIKSKPEKVTMAIAVVVIFGTIAMFFYPFIYRYMMTFLPMTESQFGIYVGSTIHEVAQVVAAGNAISDSVTETAVISKMIRVLLLAPFLLILSFYLVKQNRHSTNKNKLVIPWFAIGFLVMAAINSFGFLPVKLVNTVIWIDNLLLTMSMAALGLTTHYSSFQKAGVKPLLLGLVVFIWLIIGGAAINIAVQGALS